MFKLKPMDTPESWPVTVTTPSAHGTVSKGTFTAQFVMLKRSEFVQLSDQGDQALIERVLVGWSGIYDANGNEMPFSLENRAELLEYTHVATAISRAYVGFVAGAPAKN